MTAPAGTCEVVRHPAESVGAHSPHPLRTLCILTPMPAHHLQTNIQHPRLATYCREPWLPDLYRIVKRRIAPVPQPPATTEELLQRVRTLCDAQRDALSQLRDSTHMETAHLLLPQLLSDIQEAQHTLDWIVGDKLHISWLEDVARAEAEERARACVTMVQVPPDSELQTALQRKFTRPGVDSRCTFYMCSAADADGVCRAGRAQHPHYKKSLLANHIASVHTRPMQADHQRDGVYGYIGAGTADVVDLPGAPPVMERPGYTAVRMVD